MGRWNRSPGRGPTLSSSPATGQPISTVHRLQCGTSQLALFYVVIFTYLAFIIYYLILIHVIYCMVMMKYLVRYRKFVQHGSEKLLTHIFCGIGLKLVGYC